MKFSKIKKLFTGIAASSFALAPIAAAPSQGSDRLTLIILSVIGVILAISVIALLVLLIIKKHKENEYLEVERDKRVK